MKPRSPHDLRRTARTNMARVGVLDEVAEEVLNQIKPRVVEVNNKYRYDREKQEALEKCEDPLLEILKDEPFANEDLSGTTRSPEQDIWRLPPPSHLGPK